MQTASDAKYTDSAKREYQKPELTRREQLAEVTRGDVVVVTPAVRQPE